MRIKSRISLAWVAAAVLACALPVTQSAWGYAVAATTKLLAAQLPPGITLKAATVDQTADALYASAIQRPDLATSLLQVAILAKRPPPKHGNLPCPDLKKLLKKVTSAAPDKARELYELAVSLVPECKEDVESMLSDENQQANVGSSGFGFGLGNDFPGSPGFIGSPSGTSLALPPVSALPVLTTET